jgi:hypothetical protein
MADVWQRMGHSVEVAACRSQAQGRTTEATLHEQTFALWLSTRMGIEPLGKKACVSATTQLVP